MKNVSLLVGMLIVAMLSGCAGFDNSTGSSDQYDNSSHGGHSHH